jgi:FAD/FMN-containing dehydrogenase
MYSQLTTWFLDANGGNKQWTLPYSVLNAYMTVGGCISTMSHGAGITTKTVSDLVYGLEFVNANGDIQTLSADIEDERLLLQAAAGSFGLVGVITYVILRVSPMTYAKFTNTKGDLVKLIPPPL